MNLRCKLFGHKMMVTVLVTMDDKGNSHYEQRNLYCCRCDYVDPVIVPVLTRMRVGEEAATLVGDYPYKSYMRIREQLRKEGRLIEPQYE